MALEAPAPETASDRALDRAPLILRVAGLAPERRHGYHIAEQTLVSDLAMPELAAFAVEPAAEEGRPAHPFGTETLSTVWTGRGLVGRGERRVACRECAGGYLIDIAGIGRFGVDGDGGGLVVLERVEDGDAFLEALLGPPLLLALALRGVFVLHASAVARHGRVFAFVGRSGTGKSTIARWLDEQGFTRVADDLLAWRMGADGPEALGVFPQPKLGKGQPGSRVPPVLPFGALCLVERADPDHLFRCDALAPAAAALTLVRHSVVTKLFARPLLAEHLDRISSLAAQVPCLQWTYPHRLDVLSEACSLLEALAGRGKGGW